MGNDADVESSVDARWAAIPHPVVVVDAAGRVRTISSATQDLLPGAVRGEQLQTIAPWLATAHDGFVSGTPPVDANVSGPLGASLVEARPTHLPDGDVAWWLFERSDLPLQEAQQALARERERAAFLDEASASLTASLNLERCAEITVQLAVRYLADAAVVVAPVVDGRLPIFCADSGERVEHRSIDAEPSAVPGLAEALRGFPPVPSRWIDPASVPDWLLPDDLVGAVGSVVVTPLPGHGVPAGALVLLRKTSHMAFSDGEELFARLFAARAGAALSAARLYAEQRTITHTLMRELLPPRLHRMHGFELAGGYRASEDHHLIGGDFYDVHPALADDAETLVVLGDVCGKGLEAAVLTGKIRNTLHALAPLADEHERVLTLLNSALLSADNSRFATVVMASISRRDGVVRLRLTCAGHPAPLIVRQDGRVERADTRGTLVGALPHFKARSFETVLAPGETCLLYTDGISEARGGPLGNGVFGEDRLMSTMAECSAMPPEAVVERVMMLATQWVDGRAHDDMAVVAIASPRRTHLSAVDGHTAGRYTA